MNVEIWLEQVAKLDQLINAKLAERDQVWSMATSVTSKSSDGMPHAKGAISDPVGTGAIKLRMLAAEIDNLIDKYVDHKQLVLRMLEKLSDKEYGVLHRQYIRYMTIEEIADDMGYCTRQISRIKKNALKNLEVVITSHGMSHLNVI